MDFEINHLIMFLLDEDGGSGSDLVFCQRYSLSVEFDLVVFMKKSAAGRRGSCVILIGCNWTGDLILKDWSFGLQRSNNLHRFMGLVVESGSGQLSAVAGMAGLQNPPAFG